MPVLWVDITELFGQFRHTGHVTGVGRVVLELAEALARAPGRRFERAVPVFWDPARRRLLSADGLVPLRPLFASLSAPALAEPHPPACRGPRIARRLASSVPKPLRYRLLPSNHGVTDFLTRLPQGERPGPVRLAPGDCLFLPGSFWLDGYARRLMRMAQQAGAGVAAFVHDVLPFSRPADWRPADASQFRRGLAAVLPRAAAILCNSRHTAGELRRHLPLPITDPVHCRLGDIEDPPVPAVVTPAIAPLLSRQYVLFIASVVARKNHGALIRAWHGLEANLGEETPWLVLAGAGADILARGAGRRVVGLSGLSDGAREALYRHAWMTAYPSFQEGYGLPVAEALARGKVTLSSNRGGLAEVAPGLVDPIDPDDPASIAAIVTLHLADPARHAAREAEIRSHYCPTRWSDTAGEVSAAIEAAFGGKPPPC